MVLLCADVSVTGVVNVVDSIGRDATGMRGILNGYSIIGDDQGILCQTRNKTRIAFPDIVREALPPFHPGCRCATAPWGQPE